MLNLNKSAKKKKTQKEVVANTSHSSNSSHNAMCVYISPQTEKVEKSEDVK